MSIGKKKIDDEDNYIPNNINPEYGRLGLFPLPPPPLSSHAIVITIILIMNIKTIFTRPSISSH